jgi:hypothetical protein
MVTIWFLMIIDSSWSCTIYIHLWWILENIMIITAKVVQDFFHHDFRLLVWWYVFFNDLFMYINHMFRIFMLCSWIVYGMLYVLSYFLHLYHISDNYAWNVWVFEDVHSHTVTANSATTPGNGVNCSKKRCVKPMNGFPFRRWSHDHGG